MNCAYKAQIGCEYAKKSIKRFAFNPKYYVYIGNHFSKFLGAWVFVVVWVVRSFQCDTRGFTLNLG